MTNLKSRLERLRDIEASKYSGGMQLVAYDFKAGADAFIPMIVELAEAAERVRNGEALGHLYNALDALERRLEGGKVSKSEVFYKVPTMEELTHELHMRILDVQELATKNGQLKKENEHLHKCLRARYKEGLS